MALDIQPLDIQSLDIQALDIQPLEDEEASWGTAFKQKLAEAGNSADAAISLPAGALAGVFNQEAGDKIFRDMEARRAANLKGANPNNQKLSTVQQVAGTVGTLPAQLMGMFGAPAEKGMDLVNRGESARTAQAATLLDTAGNVAGVAPMAPAATFLGRAGIGAASNMAFGAGSDAATQLLAEQQSTKDAYDPYNLERRTVEALTGGVLQGALGERPTPKSKNPKINKMLEEQAARETPANGTSKLDITPLDYHATEGLNGQRSLFDIPEEGRMPNKYEAVTGDWRIDENGMPIKADLSMDAQNAAQPLQRNLWGDELPQKHPQENERNLPQAIDSIKDTPFKGDARDIALGRLKGEIQPSGELLGAIEAARREADSIPDGLVGSPAMKGLRKKQGGVIDSNLLTFGVANLIDRLRSNPETTQPMRRLMGLFNGTFELGALKAAYNYSLDPTSKKRVYMMSPDQFLTLAKRREPWEVAGQESTRKRASINEGLKTEAGLRQLPELTVNDKGVVIGHEGRHRSEVLASKLDLIPVVIESTMHRNEAGVLPFDKLQPQDFHGMPSKFGEPLITPETRLAHDYTPTETTVGGKLPFNFKKQGGGLLISSKERVGLDNSLAKSEDGTLIPNNPKAKEVVAAALAHGKDGMEHLWKYLQSGATSAAMKTGSPAIKAAAEIVQNAAKRADLAVRNAIFPAETALKKLSKVDITELAEIFKNEMTLGKRFDADVLTKNLSIKQLDAYTHMRDMFDKSLDSQNEARLAKGQDPITPNEAYMASRWSGDFRRPVHDKNGRLVWYLAADTKMGLEAQSRALLKQFPDLVADASKDHHVKSSIGKTDLQSMYTTMLDVLGRNDPAIEKIRSAIESQTTAEAEMVRGQEKHFERKANIRGFVGDRPGTNPGKEAVAMFQQQLQYAKNAFTWSEMQKAADDIKGIVSDPDLQAQQPNNVKYIREYFKNAIGHGESKVMRAMDDTLREGLGVSPKVLSEAIGDVKSFFILQKLAASAGFALSNVVQTANVIPYLADLHSLGYKGNPVKALGVGYLAGMMMAASHYLKAGGGEYLNKVADPFLRDAIQYAEQNGVTARSIYDESPLQASFSKVSQAANIASKTMTIPETFVRSIAFMTYSQMLKDSGKYTDRSKLFQHAEELVNKSMVDYRETEKPLIFSKGGSVGNFLNTLQTYPMSFYNQYSYMAGRAMKGSPVPLVTMLAMQAAISGAMGVPYAEDMYQGFKYLKDNLVSTSTWKDMQDSKFLSDPKLWVMETLGNGALYGALSDQSGLGMASRVAAPSVGAMLQSPVGPITDIAKQAKSVGSAVIDPTNSTKWAQAAMDTAPVGLQGLLETSGIMKDHTYTTNSEGKRVFMKTSDLAKRDASVERTPAEETMRKFGLRSQREVVEKDVKYITDTANSVANKKGVELIEKFYDAARRGDTKETAELASLYTRLTGKEITNSQMDKQVEQEYLTGFQKSANKQNMTPQEALNFARMRSILEKSK